MVESIDEERVLEAFRGKSLGILKGEGGLGPVGVLTWEAGVGVSGEARGVELESAVGGTSGIGC